MKKVSVFILILAIVTGAASASVDAYMIPLSSSIYADMDALYVMSGRAIPSAARPWSAGEAERIFSRLDASSFTDGRMAIWEHVRKELDDLKPKWDMDDEFGFGLGVEFAPEIYTHTNGEKFTIDTDWAYRFDDRMLPAKGTLDLAVSDWFYSYCELSFGISRYQRKWKEKGTWNDNDDIAVWEDEAYADGVGAIIPPYDERKGSPSQEPLLPKATHLYSRTFSSNIPFIIDGQDVDFTTPKRAIMSFGGPSWNLMFGRDRMNWGHSHIGNFTIDGHVGWHEMLRFTANTEKFKYDCTNLFMDTIPAMREETVEDPGSIPATDKDGNPRPAVDADDSVPEYFRVMMNHRLEFAPWTWFRFALSESIMWKGKALELQNFNPTFIYHQLNNRAMFNCLGGLEFYFTPVKGLNLYFEFGLDNATLIFEGNSQADANGYLIGADYTHALGKGYIEGSLEFAHTSPIMYRRDEVDFLMLQRCYTLGAGRRNATPKLWYVGFPYGPDAEVLHIGTKYRMPGVFEVGIEWNGVRKGSMDMFESHNKGKDNHEEANIVGKTPTDGGSRDFELFLYGIYEMPDLADFIDVKIKSTLAWVGKDGIIYGNEDHDHEQDVQFSLGVSVSM